MNIPTNQRDVGKSRPEERAKPQKDSEPIRKEAGSTELQAAELSRLTGENEAVQCAGVRTKGPADSQASEAHALLQMSGPGRPMPAETRESMESSFGADFSSVRVSEGPEASAMGAQAFTQGERIHFEPGRYQPTSTAGKSLLGHELAHVVQQREGRVQATGQANGVAINNDPSLEAEADQQGSAAAAGQVITGSQSAPASATKGAPVQRAVKTWDKEQEKWVSASGAGDDKMFSNVDDMSPGAQKKLETGLLQGDLSVSGIANTDESTIASIDPFGPIPRTVLEKSCEATWSEAKHVLAAGKLPAEIEAQQGAATTSEQSASLKSMMKKIWEYRQWHHDEILKRTQKRVNAETKNERGLKKWKAAGSTTLTSDIDVNLKGEETELAVGIFNEEFKKDGWVFEAGVVYDVNVYALDFMHGMGETRESDGHLVASEEGSRTGRKGGGIENADQAAVDQAKQEEWALVKMRIYMSEDEWAAYKLSVDPDNDDAAVWAKVEAKYEDYRWTLLDAMEEEVGGEIDVADDVSKTGYQQIQDQAKAEADTDGEAEDIAIAASNRVYEEKLGRVSELRGLLKGALSQYEATVKANKPGSENLIAQQKLAIDKMLVELREVISECALYSNEAYITSGGVNHAVVGLQVGKKVELTKADSMNAGHENYADTLKESGRHGGSLGEAAFKSGKYMWRLADAARNIGLEAVAGVMPLYRLGFECANTIKSMDDSADKKGLSAAKAQSELGLAPAATAADLKAKVIATGNAVTVAYKKTVSSQGKASELSSPAIKAKH